MFIFMKYFNLCLLISRLIHITTGNVRILSKDMVLSNYSPQRSEYSYHISFTINLVNFKLLNLTALVTIPISVVKMG
jgi:hypothetical protein